VRLQETARSFEELRKKDAEETRTLEEAVKKVEQALAAANQRALNAEGQVVKLQKELALLYPQLQEARRQAQAAQMQAQAATAAASAGQAPTWTPPVGADPEIYREVQSAIYGFDKLAKDAREAVRTLLASVNQVEALSVVLQNLGRLTEPKS